MAEQETIKFTNLNNEMKNEYNFMTESSKSIENSLIHFAEKTIERGHHMIELNKYVNNLKMAIDIELGIFEYALVHVTVNNLESMFITAIYMDKLREICLNLDQKSHLKNKVLLDNILNGSMAPRIIAFLSPEQMHPDKWSDILKKRQYRIDKEQNMATTDLYQCRKCKERKCTVKPAQLRALDEPISYLISCIICGNVFII